jgi:hypothetical protein
MLQKEAQKRASAKYYEKNKEKWRNYYNKRHYNDPDKQKAYQSKIIDRAIIMLSTQVIDDKNLWHKFCNLKRRCDKKYPFSEDFTDELFFDKMKVGCVYCGDPATTIDRINSSIGHLKDNCVGCCKPCNISKGNGDPNSFIRKAYYRTRKEYFDDDEDIWSDNKYKPSYTASKKKSQKQQRAFTLSQTEWNTLVTGECAYCQRSRPENKWFGVDKVIPDNGYTLENTVTCCNDCNVDKWDLSIEKIKKRNEQISNRIDANDLHFFDCISKLRNNGDNGNKVCAYGKVYSSRFDASQSLGKTNNYVTMCLFRGNYTNFIFEITDDFYNFVIKTNIKNITKKMYILFGRM